MTAPPAVVTLHVWGVGAPHFPGAVYRMASQRRRLRNHPGATFAKLLGTGSGETFTIRDSDPGHWAVLMCWDAPQAAASFERSRPVRQWDRVASERLRLELKPLRSRGRWSGTLPFGDPDATSGAGAVAALTRARLRAPKAATFWRSVPPVSAALHQSPGLRFALGLGEAPIGFQGTFSIWTSAAELRAFAYENQQHQAVIRRTQELNWYAEELFARFQVTGDSGTYRGRSLALSTT